MKNSILTLSLLAISTVAAAQPYSGVYVTSGHEGVQWPPQSLTQMRTDDGNFHTSVIDVAEGGRFCFADYGDNGTPARLGPTDRMQLPSAHNSVVTMHNGEDVAVTPSVTVTDGADMGALDLWTDKARYTPGETVWIQAAKYEDFKGSTIRYRHGSKVIAEEPLVQEWWSWTPPAADYRGYLVDVYSKDAEGNEVIHASIGVDVSSDWKMFPRYGYTAWFERGKEQYVPGDVAYLNRRHINAVQFQDWHWKHHRPYCADEYYTDVANREISHNVVRTFIESQHGYNMLSFFYNLGFGALENDDAAGDGVKQEWLYYYDANHQNKDLHRLPSDWKSDITFVDPANEEWLDYLNMRNDEVYDNLAFDGFQVDQVGKRADVLYDYQGNAFTLHSRFQPMLKSFKAHRPDKRLIMNSVSKHGANEIAASGVVDVCYSELWGEEADLNDMYWVIFDNKTHGGDKMRTVFACYMNYNYANANPGKTFNAPGILLTDACIFALGGAHLELGTGGNMLCNEYFPNTNLHMDDGLHNAVTRYYDFNTAYENYLYDTKRELTPTITSLSGHQLSTWNYQHGPQPRRVVVHGKETNGGAMVYHLLNFVKANSLSWRDFDANMPEPERQTGIKLAIDTDRAVSRAWVASPDSNACAPVEVPFSVQGRTVTVTVPSLEYWTMLVLE